MINIPAEYAQNDVLRDAYSAGYYFAIDLARFNVPEHTAAQFNAYGEGGFMVYGPDGESLGPFDTREEAEEAAREEWGEEWQDAADIEETPSADEAWQAFDDGVCAAISETVSSYTMEDYGAEGEGEGEGED